MTAQYFRKPIKVKLLNDGGHAFLSGVNFPIVVFCNHVDCDHAFIKSEELICQGVKVEDCLGMEWLFEMGSECEVLTK